MSQHEHPHHHSHEHDHGHGHHDSRSGEALTDRDRLIRIIEHWMRHNEDHASSYQDWARRAREMGSADVAGLLEEVVGQTEQQNRTFQKALDLLK